MRVNHHGRVLFPLSSAAKTTITGELNWSYNDDIDANGDGGNDDDDRTMLQGENAMGGILVDEAHVNGGC